MIDNPSNMLMRASPHALWQIGAARPIKHEPMEEDKNDSGLASGSDFHSSSPGSDASQDMHAYPPKPQSRNANLNRFYSPPIMTQAASMFAGYNHNPLTPPDSEPLVSPKSDKEEKDSDVTITPCASPNQARNEDNQNHLRRLEMTLEKNLGMSSKMSEHSMDEMSNKSDNDLDEFDDSLRVPKVNSHGKIKTFKCKHCDYVANTKTDQWNHNRIHIPPEKILTCPSPGCNFVTEYKHHFEYHLRNHTGSKPFQCKKCDYSCVNKSMLNSHMKSHSSVYRFSCRDCNYATKYCHSLKLHLRRYGHRPSVVLDDEGKPCPDIVIDVYGTRRGPKLKNQKPGSENGSPQLEGLPLGFNMGAAPQQLPVPAYHPLFSGIPAQIMQQLLHQQALAASASATLPISPAPERPQPDQDPNSVLDLSKSSSEPGPSGLGDQQKNRRKGPAYRIDPSTVAESEDEDEEMSTTMFSNVEAVVQSQDDKQIENVESTQQSLPDSNNNKKEDKTCQYCDMTFGDYVLYTIHMGYHGYKDPYTCNMCGEECSDRISFFLHIARIAHS